MANSISGTYGLIGPPSMPSSRPPQPHWNTATTMP
jgi:hypothetical protein